MEIFDLNEIKTADDAIPCDTINDFDIRSFQLLEEMERKEKALSCFLDLLEELKEIDNEKEVSFNDFVSKVRTLVNATKYQLKEKNKLGINITSIEQTRGIPYKVMILCGAIEGEFPLTFRTDKFLGKELKNSKNIHNDTEKILFYKFLTNNIDLLEKEEMRLYIFYPLLSGGVNKVKNIRSSFIDEVCNIIDKDKIQEHIISLKNGNLFSNTDEQSTEMWSNYITTNLDIIASKKSIDNNGNKYKETLQDSNISKEEHTEIASSIKNNIYSGSQLEIYADCGLKYFYKYLMNVKVDDKQDDYEFTAPEIGNYYHKILCDYYKTIKEKYNINDIKENNSKLLNELMYITNKHLKNYKEVPLFKYEVAKIKNTLQEWFNNEIKKNTDWDYTSVDFEFEFNVDINGLKLKGIIDRIEINEDTKEYIVADYKTSKGQVKSETDINKGITFQIPLYLLALKQLDKYKDYVPVNGVYYVLNADEMVHHLIKKQSKDELLDAVLNNAINYKDAIEDLYFPIKTTKEKCNKCCYYRICRINDMSLN